MSKKFELFLSQLSETNATLDYFTNFEKVKVNVSKLSIKLHQLNYLIGKDNLGEAVKELFEENPKAFSALDILIAVRKIKKVKVFTNNGQVVLLNDYFESPEKILEYIEKTGLENIFKNQYITNLVDYVFGIEVGLDTNARKNRGGENMSKAVSSFFEKAHIPYQKEVNSTVFPDIVSLGVDVKRFDFVIKSNQKTYLIETNYYNSVGSKLTEVARAYSDVAPKINQYDNYEFVWITDGRGWLSAKTKLEEAFNKIENLYNLSTLSSFIEKVKNEGIPSL